MTTAPAPAAPTGDPATADPATGADADPLAVLPGLGQHRGGLFGGAPLGRVPDLSDTAALDAAAAALALHAQAHAAATGNLDACHAAGYACAAAALTRALDAIDDAQAHGRRHIHLDLDTLA